MRTLGRISVLAVGLLMIASTSIAQPLKARGTSSLSSRGVGTNNPPKKQNFPEPVAVATGTNNYYPNLLSAFQVGSDTLDQGWMPPRAKDTTAINTLATSLGVTKPLGLTAWFYVPKQFGTWNGSKWVLGSAQTVSSVVVTGGTTKWITVKGINGDTLSNTSYTDTLNTGLAPVLTSTATATLSLTATAQVDFWIYKGTGVATWTMPDATLHSGQTISIKNASANAVAINLNAFSSGQIWTTTGVNVTAITQGSAYNYTSDGTYWHQR